MKNFAIGADIGGSHISCAVIDLEKEIIVRESYSTVEVDNKASAEEILEGWSEALQATISHIGKNHLAGLGFAMPGPFDYAQGIALFTPAVAKFEHLYGINVVDSLKKKLGLSPETHVRFMNDAISFAVGEAWMGKTKEFGRSVAITLGTGFGSAFIDHGIPVVEGNEVPANGYVYHLPFGDGIADEHFSTRWFIKAYAEKTGILVSGVKEITSAAVSDPLAMEVFTEFGTNLGEFLLPLLSRFKAEALVIGGNITGAYHLFGDPFEQSLQRQGMKITVGLSELKEDAALIGSARLLDKNFYLRVKPLLTKM